MRLSLVLCTLAVLTGCASVSPQPFSGPGGGQAYYMRCSGMGRSMEECYRKAGEVCPHGYNVIDHTANTEVGTGPLGVMSVTKESLAVECKA